MTLAVDLNAFPECVPTIFPQSQIQTYIADLLHNFLDSRTGQHYRIMSATTGSGSFRRLPRLGRGIRSAYGLFAYPPEDWKVLYTTTALGRLQMRPRKIVANCGHFPQPPSCC